MNLILDAGNSFLKLAVFENGEVVELQQTDYAKADEALNGILQSYPAISKGIISVVSHFNLESIRTIPTTVKMLTLNHNLSLPFVNLYATPKTLGVDRIALMAAAVQKFPSQNVLVIDAGTCITYDFKNAEEAYYGGKIAPGLHMRYMSLSHFTAKLPLLDPEFPNNMVGNTTEQSIHSGVSEGVVMEIEGVISAFSNKYEDLVVILAGGDANFLSKRLKNGIFVDPNFLLHGLNHILDYTITR